MGEFQSIILVVESFDVYDTLDLGVLAFEMDVTLLWNCSLLKKKKKKKKMKNGNLERNLIIIIRASIELENLFISIVFH